MNVDVVVYFCLFCLMLLWLIIILCQSMWLNTHVLIHGYRFSMSPTHSAKAYSYTHTHTHTHSLFKQIEKNSSPRIRCPVWYSSMFTVQQYAKHWNCFALCTEYEAQIFKWFVITHTCIYLYVVVLLHPFFSLLI